MIHPPVYIQRMTLPAKFKAMITKVFDDSAGEYFVIMISDRLSNEEAKQAYQHELYHIYNGDFDSELTADRLEFQTLIRTEADSLPAETNDYCTLLNDPFREEVAI